VKPSATAANSPSAGRWPCWASSSQSSWAGADPAAADTRAGADEKRPCRLRKPRRRICPVQHTCGARTSPRPARPPPPPPPHPPRATAHLPAPSPPPGPPKADAVTGTGSGARREALLNGAAHAAAAPPSAASTPKGAAGTPRPAPSDLHEPDEDPREIIDRK